MNSNLQHVNGVHSEHDIDDIEADSDNSDEQKDLETEDLEDIQGTIAGPYIPSLEALGIIDDEIEEEPAASDLGRDVMSNREFIEQSTMFRRSQQYDRRRDNIRLTLNSAELLRSTSGVSSLVLPEEFMENEIEEIEQTDSPRELMSSTNSVANPLANPVFIRYIEDEDDSGDMNSGAAISDVDGITDDFIVDNVDNGHRNPQVPIFQVARRNDESSDHRQEPVTGSTSISSEMNSNLNENNGDEHDSNAQDGNEQRGHRNPQVPIFRVARRNGTETRRNRNESTS